MDRTGASPPRPRNAPRLDGDHRAISARHRVLGGASRQALLSALRRAGRPLDAGEAGAAVQLHRNTARVQLEQLCSIGALTKHVEQRTRRGRPRVLYSLAAEADVDEVVSGGTNDAYRELARVLAQQLAELPDNSREAIRAGRRWAATLDTRPLAERAIGSISELTALLAALGFAPELGEHGRGADRILLRRCPFADIARENRAVICAVHLGMLESAVARLGLPVGAVRLEPLVSQEPLLCVVELEQPSELALS